MMAGKFVEADAAPSAAGYKYRIDVKVLGASERNWNLESSIPSDLTDDAVEEDIAAALEALGELLRYALGRGGDPRGAGCTGAEEGKPL